MLAVLEDDDPRAGVIRDELHRVIDDYPYYAQKYLKIAVCFCLFSKWSKWYVIPKIIGLSQ